MTTNKVYLHACAQYCREGQFGEVGLGTSFESSEG